jgi:hypothetical protein
VVNLRYHFVSRNELDRFGKARPMTLTADDFGLELVDDVLTATPQDHFATIEEARAGIEPFLDAWSAHARLERARRVVGFEFEDAKVIDRTDGSRVYASVARASAAAANAAILVEDGVYPAPPVDFRTDLVLDAILARLADLDGHRTSITDATYWVVTRVEAAYGSSSGSQVRASAATALGLETRILDDMGRLASQNDPILGRKAKGTPRELTENEKAWMRAAIVLVAKQVGTFNAGIQPPPGKTMANLPAQ